MAIDAGQMYASLGLRLTGIAQAQQGFMNAMKSMSKQVTDVQQRLTALEQQASHTGKAMTNSMRAVAPAVQTATKSVEQMGTSIFQSAQRWRTFGYLFSIVVTAPMVMAGKQAINTAKDFDFAMAKIVGLVGLSADKVAKLREEILRMAPALAQTPQALAEAAYYVTSAGFKDTAQALKIVEIAARGATAGLGETADVAKLLVFSMNAYRQSGLKAEHAADVFTAAVREGAIEAEGFAGAMQSVLPIASALGVKIEEVAGTMAAMSLQGASAQNAAVYLKGVLNSLLKLKPTSGGGKELENMGVSVDGLIKKLREPGGLMKVLIELKDLAKDVGGVPFLKNVFRDIRAMTGDLSLMGDNFLYNKQVIESVTNASGDLGRAFLAQTKEMKKRLDSVNASLDVMKIRFGEALGKVIIPFLENLIKILNNVVTWFGNLSAGAQNAIIKFLGLIAAIGPLALLGSVAKYAWGGFFVFFGKRIIWMRSIVKALNGDLLAMNNASVASKGLTSLAKKLSAKALDLGGWGLLAKHIAKGAISFGRMAAPAAAVAAAVGYGAIKLFKYAKEARIAFENNQKFNSTMIAVNEQMKKFNEITTEDIGQMSLDEMMIAQQKAADVWREADALYQQFIKNKEDSSWGGDKQNQRLADQQLERIKIAKDMYDSLGDARKNMLVQLSAEKRAQDQLKIDEQNAKLKEHNQALVDEFQKIKDTVTGLNEKAKAMKEAGIPFDLLKEKADVLLKAIDTLTGEEFKLKVDSKEVIQILLWLRQLGVDLTETGKKTKEFTDDLNSSLASVNMQKFILGPKFDANTAKLEVYKKAVEEYIKILTEADPITGSILSPTQEQINKLQNMQKEVDRYSKTVQDAIDRESVALLNAEANAFGNIAGKVEVLNYELQASERYLKDLLKRRYGGEFIDSEEIKRTVQRIQNVQMALVDLQNSQSIQYLEDMNRTFYRLQESTDLFSGHISALENKLQALSEMGKGSSIGFKILYKQLSELKDTEVVVNRLGDSLGQMFDVLIEGGTDTETVWQRLGDTMQSIFQQLLKDITHLIIKTILWKTVLGHLEVPDDIAKSMKESVTEGLAAIMTGMKKINFKIKTPVADRASTAGGLAGIFGNLSGKDLTNPDELIPSSILIDAASKRMKVLTEATSKYGTAVKTVSELEQIGTQALEVSNTAKQGATAVTQGLAVAEQVQAKTKEATTLATAAAIPAEKAMSAVEAASIPITEAKTSADAGSAVASTIKNAAKLPWPLGIMAIGIGLGAVMAGVAAIIKAKKSTKMAQGGTVPKGFPNDSFPALLTSGEVVLPEDKIKMIFGEGYTELIKKHAPPVAKMATGGIVPAGYPRDSFPALLSSGEKVIPLNRVEKETASLDGEVVFRISQDELLGILRKGNKKNKIY